MRSERRKIKVPDETHGSGHTAAVARGTSYFSDTSYYNDMTGGIGYYKFLEDCKEP